VNTLRSHPQFHIFVMPACLPAVIMEGPESFFTIFLSSQKDSLLGGFAEAKAMSALFGFS